MAEMCGAGLHEMTGDNQYRDGAGRKMGCRACHWARGKRRDDTWCRNWHERTEENTHVDERGKRWCKDCPSWPAYEERMNREHKRDAPRLTEKEVRRLRASVPCVVCGQIPREFTVTMKQKDPETGGPIEATKIIVKIEHWPTCPVPHNREGDGKGPGRPRGPKSRAVRDQSVVTTRPDTPCGQCGRMIKQPWKKRTIMYCGDSCKSKASRERLARKGTSCEFTQDRRTLDAPTSAT